MAQTEFILPKMGESVAEATITRWLKAEGDAVKCDETIVEIATDKVDSEIPSPVNGIISKILHKEGETIAVGTVMAIISELEKNAITTNEISENSASETNSNGEEQSVQERTEITATPLKTRILSPKETPRFHKGRFYSPLVRNIARVENVSLEALEKISGTGLNNRLTKNDLLNYLKNRMLAESPADPVPAIKAISVENMHRTGQSVQPKPQPQTIKVQAVPYTSGEEEIIEMDRVRKLIADHMVMSKHTSPHITSFVEADVTNIVQWRNKFKEDFEKREGEKLTFTPIFIEAAARAVRDFPMVNVSVDGTRIIVKKNINIGMATALPSGNLIVPVIKNADRMNLYGLAKAVNDLAKRARENKLAPDEIQGGTFTITNVGTFGNVMGTPIINQPQVAILATGIIQKKPVVIETPGGDTIGIRQMMFLSLSYDHRVVDGALGGRYLRKVADYLEQFDVNRDI